MAEPVPDWKDREFAPSTLPEDGELTYPEPAGAFPPALPGMSTDDENDTATGSSRSHRPSLNSAAEKVGSALGSTVGNVRSRLRVVGGRSVAPAHTGSLAGVDNQASRKASEWTDVTEEQIPALKDSASEWKETAGERIAELQTIARQQVHVARRRAAYYANEYPIQTILSLAGLAFVVGCALRIWRANSD